MKWLYPYAYLGMLATTLLWFYFHEKKVKTSYVKIGFFISLMIYSFCLVFGDGGIFRKLVFVLARDIGLLVGVVLIGNNLAKSSIKYAATVTALAAFIWFFYFNLLTVSLVNPGVPLDPKGELLVDVKDPAKLKKIKSVLAGYKIKMEKAFPNLRHDKYSELDDYYVLDVPDDRADELDEIMDALFDSKTVDWVERNEIIKLNPPEQDGGTSAAKKIDYGLNDPDIGKQWGFEKMRMDVFYKYLEKKNIRPKKVARIAILDTGVDAGHEDLKNNFRSTDKKFDKDVAGHGTHCAGIASAVSNNAKGIASLVPDNKYVKVTSIKVLGDHGGGTQRSVIMGMIKAADSGADVLSMSLGGHSDDSAQRAYNEAVKYAGKAGAIVVAAAGNSNANAKRHVPAGAKGVICVSAVDENLKKANFSNYVNDVEMGIAAPGVNIYSTFPGNKYVFLNGTSMATPYVAGLLGMMKSIKPDLTAEKAFQILKSTGIATGDQEKTGMFIQPAKVLEKL